MPVLLDREVARRRLVGELAVDEDADDVVDRWSGRIGALDLAGSPGPVMFVRCVMLPEELTWVPVSVTWTLIPTAQIRRASAIR